MAIVLPVLSYLVIITTMPKNEEILRRTFILKNKNPITGFLTRTAAKACAVTALTLMLLVAPTTVYADNTAHQNNNFTNPNWQNMHHYDYWNLRHNWAYQAPGTGLFQR